MRTTLRFIVLGACLALSGLFTPSALALAAEPASAESDAEAPRHVLLRVAVDAAGKVQSATSLDPEAVPALVTAASEVARKLSFSPAQKNGRAVPSETSLVVTLKLVPQGGGYGISLLRAQNGPSVVAVGKTVKPNVNARENGGLVVVSADLRADGSVDIETFKVDRVDMRVPATFAQEQFERTARMSLKDTRFMLDKVDGIEIPSRVHVPFQFNGGPAKREPGDKGREKPKKEPPPSMTAESRIEGVVLPKIDYTAPAK